ncbi:histidine-containing phosphotransfer protein 2 isoform X2 [Cajanus cajan]|uniref:histidine-containing phosphotransfer protein 2 isoform X2 n=1 Tax=Cajanus cajan TaxID=3821 RepID=UPI00098DB566|nr:histidine-containing phosphotransfer protein 2 isoform X2 [Cajanus cajan]
MAITTLKIQLHSLIRSMYDEGMVNEDFLNLQSMRLQPHRRDSVLRAVTSYCFYCRSTFSSLTSQIEQERVNFTRVGELARDFYAKTCNIGAESVRRACVELVHASEKKDKDGCYLALYWTKNRFSHLRLKFETLVKGVVNELGRIYFLKSTGGLDCAVQLIEKHFADVDTILQELSHHVDIPKVDICKLGSLACEMVEKSARQEGNWPRGEENVTRKQNTYICFLLHTLHDCICPYSI